MSRQISITHFTDPACPFAFSAEPTRWRLRWHYGDQLEWQTRMIVLTREQGEAENLAKGAPTLQKRHGMPINPEPYERPASSEPASRAFVAARVNAPDRADRLLRALRVRTMAGGLLDDPELIAGATGDAGIDLDHLSLWSESSEVEAELEADIEAARSPSEAARALDHKLGGPAGRRRLTAPSYEFAYADRTALSVPGFTPVEAYEAAIANLAPRLERRAKPSSVAELLEWAGEPLATAEVVAIMQRSEPGIRAELAASAVADPAGADMYWRLGA
ncbi:hypothetical protein BH10ACT11_BH10ACT11_05460 [soil metagenome]